VTAAVLLRRMLAVPLLLVTAFQATRTAAADEDWRSYNHRLNGNRYSTLDQINTGNVGQLQERCRVRLADTGSLSTGPLLVNGVLYVTMNDLTVALDPTDCRVRWRSEYASEEPEVLPNNRGVACLSGRLFRGTGDGRVLALDAATGRELWRRKIGDPTQGEFVSAAPLAWNGRVFVGLSGGELGIRGRMVALDALSGATLWTFDLVPGPGEYGSGTWAGDSWRHGGGATWSSYALDENTGELFVSVDNPAPAFNRRVRGGDNLFTDSVVALDSRTGRRLWHLQLRRHDTRDYGASAPAVLIEVNGRSLLAQGSKDGYLYVIDRHTHHLVHRTAVTTIGTGDADPTPRGEWVCPGISGGFLYNSPAVDPQNDRLISGTVDWCSTLYRDPSPPRYQPRREFVGGRQEHTGLASGWVTSVSAVTGRVAWRFHTDAPVFAAVTTTAGGVTFTGDHAGLLYALRTADGALLWRHQTSGSIAGGIITYQIGSEQYLAVTSGSATLSPSAAAGPPSIVVFALPNDRTTPRE
jgi:alcohol dehydrogenase (cytochrome c)